MAQFVQSIFAQASLVAGTMLVSALATSLGWRFLWHPTAVSSQPVDSDALAPNSTEETARSPGYAELFQIKHQWQQVLLLFQNDLVVAESSAAIGAAFIAAVSAFFADASILMVAHPSAKDTAPVPGAPWDMHSQPVMRGMEAQDCGRDLIAALDQPAAVVRWHYVHEIAPALAQQLSERWGFVDRCIIIPLHQNEVVAGFLLLGGKALTRHDLLARETGEYLTIISNMLSMWYQYTPSNGLIDQAPLGIAPSDVAEPPSALATATIEQNARNQQTAFLRQVINALLTITRTRSIILGTNPLIVADLAKAIALEMQIDLVAASHIRVAALVCDIGMVAIPDSITHKTSGLTPDDWQSIRTHPQVSIQILQEIDIFHAQLEIIRHHHENWDGSGYPAGLRKLAIPLGSRILAVADAFVNMQQQRSYRTALSEIEALEQIESLAGIRFDPDVAAALHVVILRRQQMLPAVAA